MSLHERRKTLLVGGSLTLVVALAGGSVAWASIPRGPDGGAVAARLGDDVGVAGPLGPQGFAGVASYFKRVTFATNQLGQLQYISVHLPAGRYLVEMRERNPPAGGPDCAGVTFPLVPAVSPHGGYSGFATVADDGQVATVACYEEAQAANSTATYELFYIPANDPAPGARQP